MDIVALRTDAPDIGRYLIAGTDPDVHDAYASLAGKAASSALELVEDEVVVLDTETTGLNPAYDELIEIGAVVLRGNNIVDRFETFVKPSKSIPPEIVELTGITDADVSSAPDAFSAVEELAAFTGTRDIIAHNAPFDRSFIMRKVQPGALRNTWLDTLQLSRILLPRLRSHRLADLAEAFSMHAPGHRAMDDVLALAAIWRVLMFAAADLPTGLPQLIAEISPDTEWPERKVFARVAASQPDARFSLRGVRRARTNFDATVSKFDAEEIPLLFPEESELREAFSASGTLGTMYPQFETRQAQVDMALEILDAYRSQGLRAIEAGTGVGKSMAYLLPTALFAKRNAICCGVATKTNALMDQLVYHELPRLSAALGGVRYMALKGYDHYPCLRKLERFISGEETLSTGDIEMAAMLHVFAAQTTWGDLDALNLHWASLQRGSVEANPNDCLKTKCPYFPRLCFLHGARRCANSADIVVTNHALLFRDMQMDNGILPPIRHWVVDEAHAAETEARRQLSHTISARELEFSLNRLAGGRSNLVSQIRRRAADLDGGDMLYGVTADIDARAEQVKSIAQSFFSFVKDLGADSDDAYGAYSKTTLWISPELRESTAWSFLDAPGHSLARKLEGLVKRGRDLVSMLEQFEGAFSSAQADLANILCSAEEMMQALVLVLDGTDTSYVYSAQIDRNPERTAEVLQAEKLDIGNELAASFYPSAMSVVYTSATLTTSAHKSSGSPGSDTKSRQGGTQRADGFSHFLHTSGLDLAPADRIGTCALESGYDFEHNMTIFLPTDMPEPNARGYRDALERLMLEVHEAMGGSVLTLFTNRRDMEAVYRDIKPVLADKGIELAAQTRGVSMRSLRERFLEEESLSLLALRSFWEGFDAPGSTLRCVIVPKLPFGRPTDPIACERQLREQNKAWRRYSLPEAIMDLKQAAGRLIRNATDSGYLVLADARLQTKGYGRNFLNAMPTHDIRTASTEEIARHMSGGGH